MNIDLSHPKGKIVFNDFSINEEKSLSMQLDSLKEDMLQIEYPNGYLLDIGWRPSFDPNGLFYIYLVKDFDWEKPVYSNSASDLGTLELRVNQALKILV